MRVAVAPMVKGDQNIAALQRRREVQLQGESVAPSPSRARDNAPAGTAQPLPQTPSSSRDDLVGDILSDYAAHSPPPSHRPTQPPPVAKPKTATIGQLAAAWDIPMEGVVAPRTVSEDEIMEANELNPGVFLKGHTPQVQLSQAGIAAAALSKMTPKT